MPSPSAPFTLQRRFLPALVFALATAIGFAATAEKKSFTIPAGSADKSLALFSTQSGMDVIYPAALVRGVRTSAVSGEMTPAEAVSRLLAGTGLTGAQDEKTGAFSISGSAGPNGQRAAQPATSDRPNPMPNNGVRRSEPANQDEKDSIHQLSPFEVTGQTRGYYSTNVMSGTRFNTKLEDLASSLTVVTKDQMNDFAMLDINDVFLYTANTEGSGTYTDVVLDRSGQLYDNVQLNPTQANRIRGLTSANISLGNVETMGRVPVDPLAIDAVEISRGPNANVFGLGNPSGTVNMVPSSANLTRNFSQLQLRADSYDGYRGSLDLNRVLLKNKLAVRASGSLQHDGFERKPSGVDTSRYNAMVKYRPFPDTMISGSYSYYRMSGNRPNFTPPRDSVSYWLASGRPGWDPVNQVIHVGGRTLGPFTSATGVPDYMVAATTGGRTLLYVDQSGLAYWTMPSTVGGNNPTAAVQAVRFMTSGVSGYAGSSATTSFAGQTLFATTPSIIDKGLYDWSSINLSAVNRLLDKTESFNVQLDQRIFHTARQSLSAQVSFAREDAERYKRTIIGDTGVSGLSGSVQVDVNERLLDGTTNPFFGRPFVYVSEPMTRYNPSLWDTTRAQLAYKLDLTKESNWLKWLGAHELSGYDEFKYRVSRSYAYRDTFTSSHSWIPAGSARGNDNTITGGAAGTNNVYRGIYRYYIGDANGSNVDYAPGDFKYGPATFVWGSYTLDANLPVAGSGVFTREPVTLGQVATTDSTGGGFNVKQIIKTQGGVIQSHFLGDKLVTTFGLRRDYTYAKAGSTPQQLSVDGMNFDHGSIDHWAAGDYASNTGLTKTAGAVVRPFRDLSFVRAGAKNSGLGGFAARVLQGLSLTYNKSDSFVPATPAQDIFLRPLPNPSGTGKDYGFWLDLFEGKLVLRFNRYENKQLNSRNGEVNTLLQRVTRIDTFLTDAWQLRSNATDWITGANPAWTTAQVQAEVAKTMGLTQAQINVLTSPNPPLAATNDITARGTEVELNYNPTRFWTVAMAGAQTESINSNISESLAQWIAFRMPVWTSIIDPRFNTSWWTRLYTSSNGPQRYFLTNVDTPYKIIKALEGKSSPQIRKYSAKVSISLQLAGLTEHRWLKHISVGGALRWEDRGAIGYYGKESLPAIITALDPAHPIYDKAHFYADAFIGYRTRLFADRIGTTFRLNVRNLQEGGRLQPIGAFPDGTPHSFRIVDPRQFIFSATFDL
jgi:hypothetical protein